MLLWARWAFGRVFGKVKELRLVHLAVHRIVFDEFPVALPDAAHAGFGTAAVHTVEHVANRGLFAFEHGFETESLVGFGRRDAGEIAERAQQVEQVDVARGARAGGDARAPWQ